MPSETNTPDQTFHEADGGVKGPVAPPVPYFRLDAHQKRVAYAESGVALMERLAGGNGQLIGSGWFTGMAEVFADALAVPEDPIITAGEWETADLDADADLGALQDGQIQRREHYRDFSIMTQNWRAFGVGDIRTLYYLMALTKHATKEDCDPLRIGGFPPTLHTPTFNRRGIQRHKYNLGVEVREWLAYDAALGEMLLLLGVTWLDIEDAVRDAFIASLPEPYKTLLNEEEVPCALYFALWAHDFRRWKPSASYTRKVKKFADSLADALRPVPDPVLQEANLDDFRVLLTRLQQAMTVPGWVLVGSQSKLEQFQKVNPPTIVACYKAIADTLVPKISNLSRTQKLPLDAPEFVQRLFDVMAGRGGDGKKGQQSLAFCQLVADLVYHLPIMRAMPTEYYSNGVRKPPAFHDANYVRYILLKCKPGK